MLALSSKLLNFRGQKRNFYDPYEVSKPMLDLASSLGCVLNAHPAVRIALSECV